MISDKQTYYAILQLRVPGVRAAAGLFPFLRVNPALGRSFTDAKDNFGQQRVVVLGHRFWRERFGGAVDALGKTLILDGSVHTLIGACQEIFHKDS